MLPTHLEQILEVWVNKELIGSGAAFNPFRSNIVSGEIIVAVKRELTLHYPGHSIAVQVKKHFQTSTLNSEPLSTNPKADEYRLKIFLSQVDSEFVNKVTEAENKLIEEFNPDGFFG